MNLAIAMQHAQNNELIMNIEALIERNQKIIETGEKHHFLGIPVCKTVLPKNTADDILYMIMKQNIEIEVDPEESKEDALNNLTYQCNHLYENIRGLCEDSKEMRKISELRRQMKEIHKVMFGFIDTVRRE